MMTQAQIDAVVEAFKRDPKSVWCRGLCRDWPTLAKTVEELEECISEGDFYEVREPVVDAQYVQTCTCELNTSGRSEGQGVDPTCPVHGKQPDSVTVTSKPVAPHKTCSCAAHGPMECVCGRNVCDVHWDGKAEMCAVCVEKGVVP